MKRALRDNLGLKQARIALSAGSGMSADVFRRFHALGVPLRNLYGSTEAGLVSAHWGGSFDPGTLGRLLQVDPARAGENAVHVYLIDQAGRQMDLPESPTFSFRLESEDIGPITRTPWRVGRGHYTLDGPEMSLPGRWTVEIRARTLTFDEATATVEVPVR